MPQKGQKVTKEFKLLCISIIFVTLHRNSPYFFISLSNNKRRISE